MFKFNGYYRHKISKKEIRKIGMVIDPAPTNEGNIHGVLECDYIPVYTTYATDTFTLLNKLEEWLHQEYEFVEKEGIKW